MRKLSQGEQVKIAADDYNRWQEAGRAHAMSRLNQSQQIVTPDSQEGIVLVKNTLSRVMPRFSVLGLRGSVYNPLYSDQQLTEFKNQIALIGETPSSVTSGRFCVLQNDAQPGEVVAGMVSGVTPCRIKVEALTDEFAEIETTTTVDQTRYLKSGGSGSAQILHRPEYLGEQWGVVRLGNRPAGETEIVQVVHSGIDPDEIVLANSGGVHPGYVGTVDEHDITQGAAVWILFVDRFDIADGNAAAKNQDYYGPARRCGSYTVSDVELPLYAVRRGEVMDIVEVHHTSKDPGDVVEANASGYHPGKLRQYDGTTAYADKGEIWIQFVDGFDGHDTASDNGEVLACHGEYYGPAKLVGKWDNSGDVRPVYIVECSEREFLCKADSSISKGSSGTVSLYNADETDSTINRTAKALFSAISTSKWCIYHRIAGKWYVSKAEC